MKFIKNIQIWFERRQAINEVLEDIKDLDEVLLAKRLEIFDEIVTPRFKEIGLVNWNGKYIWSGNFNDDGIKHIVEYNVFKVFGGCFSYGNCYDFIPTVSAGKAVYHKTLKSARIIYYKRFPGWEKNISENRPINKDRISTINETKFRKTLTDVLDRNLPLLKIWFANNQTIPQNIESLLAERKNENREPGFAQRIISFDYVLAFLFARQKDISRAEVFLEDHAARNLHEKSQLQIIREKLFLVK